MLSKMLFAFGAISASSLQQPPIWELDIFEDPDGVGINVGLEIGSESNPEEGWDNKFMTQIDTGSCNLVIPHEACVTCNSDHKYSSLKDEDTYQRTKWTRIKNYLGARFETVQVMSKLNLAINEQPVKRDIIFEVATSQFGNQKWSGILGLCPQKDQKHQMKFPSWNKLNSSCSSQICAFRKFMFKKNRYNDDQRDHYRSSMAYQISKDHLKENTLENKFSIFLSKEKGQSKFTFGGISTKLQGNALTYYEIKIIEVGNPDYRHNYWSIPFEQAQMGTQPLASKAKELVLDTGCTLHQARKSFVDQFIEQSGGLTDCKRYGKRQDLICKCSKPIFDGIPDLEFAKDKDDNDSPPPIVLGRDHYVQFNERYQMCSLMFQELPENWEQDLIVFGLPFFRQYFSEFDNTNFTIGLMAYDKLKIAD